MLVANSHATFTPIQGEAPGTNILHLTLTVNGSQSTGAFAGKVGTIEALGIARQFPPNPAFGGPGQTVFELHYKGQICLP